MKKEFFIIGNCKIIARADSYIKLLQSYLELEEYQKFTPIQEWLEDLDECECEEGESCCVCDDCGDKNIVFQLDKNGEDTRFLKIPEEIIGTQEEMAKWLFENSDVLNRGDVLYEGEEIEDEESFEFANKENLIKIRSYSELLSMGEEDFCDFSMWDLKKNESIFEIKELQSGTRKISNFIKIEDEL